MFCLLNNFRLFFMFIYLLTTWSNGDYGLDRDIRFQSIKFGIRCTKFIVLFLLCLKSIKNIITLSKKICLQPTSVKNCYICSNSTQTLSLMEKILNMKIDFKLKKQGFTLISYPIC